VSKVPFGRRPEALAVPEGDGTPDKAEGAPLDRLLRSGPAALRRTACDTADDRRAHSRRLGAVPCRDSGTRDLGHRRGVMGSGPRPASASVAGLAISQSRRRRGP